MAICSEKQLSSVVFVTGCLMAGDGVGGPSNQIRSRPSNPDARVTNFPAIPAAPRAMRRRQQGWGCAAEGLSEAGSPLTGVLRAPSQPRLSLRCLQTTRLWPCAAGRDVLLATALILS